MSVEEAKAYVVNMKLAERLTEAVNAAIKEMRRKPSRDASQPTPSWCGANAAASLAILAPPP